MSTMSVAVFAGEGRLELQERMIPAPVQPDDVIVAVSACGICGTDLNILAVPPAHKAKPGIVIGHEAVGVVAEIGAAVTHLTPGERVVIAPRLTCGECYYCRLGLSNQCENYQTIGTTLDGAFAPYVCAPERALYAISPQVPEGDAVFFEPLSCVMGTLARAPVRPGDRVAIIGAGPMGLLFALVYRAQGAGKVIIADVAPYRLEYAQKLGFDVVLDARQGPLRAAILQHSERGCDVVVDAVGNQIDTAITLARRGGQVILFGLRPHDNPALNQYTITRNDLTVIGSFVGLHPFLPTLHLLESGFRPSVLISHWLPLAEARQGVELMRAAQALKVVLKV
jgi:threonine dehydrogenase-like Zn-dependent dehydrogenase